MSIRLFFFSILFFMLISCSKDEPIYKPTEKSNPYNLYKEAYEAFELNDFFYANKKFDEAEVSFEKVELAAKSAVMSIFSLYGINFYDEALENIDRFLLTYPADKNVIYVEYLKAVIFFEQISNERKDLQPLLDASSQIDLFEKKYPDSDYTIDLKFKKDLIQNQLAAKELFNAKYYISVKKWIPAINRLKVIVNDYDKTIFIEESLHRLVEIHYFLGLENEAKKYAQLLGYNYNSSEWFEKSYKILNNEYVLKEKLIKKNNKDSIIKKIIKIIK